MVESALTDAKAARALQNACKAHLKRQQISPATGKRPPAASSSQTTAKRAKYDGGYLLGPTETTPQQLEGSLFLPLDMDEERIAQTVLQTNRAPLVLAFALEVVRHTMPEQPPSSRLSIAQALVSANSRSKAVSIGMAKGPSADEEGLGEGQPRIKVMGREIAVLKRGGYEWKGDEEQQAAQKEEDTKIETQSNPSTFKAEASQSKTVEASSSIVWSTSTSVSLKESTFMARSTTITEPSQRPNLLKGLMTANPNLRSASHNVWAYRIRPAQSSTSTHQREASHDDGESGAGDLLLRVMRETNVVDTIVVMTRWYGGIMLGPDRWRLMRNVVTGALSERLRRTGVEASLGGEAVWGLDLEAMRDKTKAAASTGRLVIHRPEAARSYLLRSFATAPVHDGETRNSPVKKKTVKAHEAEKEENLSLLLGALRLLFDSWADTLTTSDLDNRAWKWYSAVRPEVEDGLPGWGAKGVLKLKTILDLRRNGD